MPGCRTLRGLRRSAAVLGAALVLTAGVSACGSDGSSTNTSGAPAFTVPTGTIAAPSSQGTTSTSKSKSTTSSTSDTTSDGASDTTPATTPDSATTPATTPASETTPQTTPQTTPDTTGGAGATTGATNPTDTTGGAGLGQSFCKENPGAC